jgi:hypothetical protein
MATRKKLKDAAGAAEDQLKAGAKKVQAGLVTVEKAAEKWTAKAKQHVPAAADVKAELPAVGRRLRKAKASVSRRKGHGPDPVASDPVTPDPAPDDSWTVAELRAECGRRGLTGYSRKTKAQLLAVLRG